MNWKLLSTLGIVCGALGWAGGDGGGAGGRAGSGDGASDAELAALVRRSADANKALVRGDIDEYLSLIQHAKDYTLMNPFGGPPDRGFEDTPQRRAGMKKFFKGGSLDQELVETYESDSGDLVVLVTVERVRAAVGDLAEQDWSLRVTQVFRRTGAGWELVHRHADPLSNRRTVEQTAAIARGPS
jgi:ketosteroid isomerase-like protein